MGHPVVHFQIGAKNDTAAAEFYGKLFGWTATPVTGMPYQMIQTNDKAGIQGGIARAASDAEAVITFYVEVPDVSLALEQAVALGATVMQPAVQVMPTLTLGMFVDPEGRAIGLSHDTTPRPAPTEVIAATTAAPAKRAAKAKKAGKSLKAKPKGKKKKKSKR